MTKYLYKHFNPEVHKIESKIATVRAGHHCKFNINYHIIWIPKYRKPILKGKVKDVLSTIINGICYELKYLGYKFPYKKFDNLWARGYYCGSAGHVSQEQVKRYIQEQEGKDVFEYDIYGCRKN